MDDTTQQIGLDAATLALAEVAASLAEALRYSKSQEAWLVSDEQWDELQAAYRDWCAAKASGSHR